MSKAASSPSYSSLSINSSDKEVTVEKSTDATTSKVGCLSGCSHSPQCISRHPDPPPPFAPLTFVQYYNPYHLSPGAHIIIFPEHRMTHAEFCELNISHECEDCDLGSLFSNYAKRVEYDCPGLSGGAPNHPKASIKLKDTSEVSHKISHQKTI